ncbi:MAG: hypothetical protein ACI9F9_000111 [Candidatus Paceibacteria bacterium]|jgi:hypothetical protein
MPPPEQKSLVVPDSLPGHDLRQKVSALGMRLARDLHAVTDAIPGNPAGPQRLAKALGLDKVFASRLLKALRNREPLTVIYQLPGPDPLRRFLVACRKIGVPSELVLSARESVDTFEGLIRDEAGDRGALGAILSAWLPEVRGQLELRARQAAYRAVGQIRGAQAEFGHSTVLLHPGADGLIDIVWLIGMVGLQRLRPGATVKFDTCRKVVAEGERRPTDLAGKELMGPALGPENFCTGATAPIEIRQAGEVVHYVLGDTGFGPRSAVDVLFCEVNLGELPDSVPAGSGRRAWFFADVPTPVKRACMDVFVHRDVYPGRDPSLLVYDRSTGGLADVNDPSRDIDLLETDQTITTLGYGLDRTPQSDLPRYRELLEHVHSSLGWNAADFRGYRVRSEYPIPGSQTTLAFHPPERS